MSDGSTEFTDYWQAQSGPFKKGAINEGTWIARKIVSTNEAGMARDGVGWKVYLDNQFGRNGMRIHPDQLPAGSYGCISLQENAHRLNQFYSKYLEYYQAYGIMRVHVDYSGF